MIGGLPETLTVGGREYPIRTDYRDVLQVLEAFQMRNWNTSRNGSLQSIFCLRIFPALTMCWRQ